MLFVFQVDTGRTMTFDMSLALESVENLKSHVEQAFKIPVDKQVLLISGGEHLRADRKVCSYPTGTDTNPIFLFSKAVIESDQPPVASVDHSTEHDISAKVQESIELPINNVTLQKRAQLARLFGEVSQGQIRTCENLVHEQHLQQQGWSAVVANLEDLNADLKHRWNLYREAFDEYITKRDSYLAFLNHFKNDLLLLQKIPVLPALIESQNLIVPDPDNYTEDRQPECVKSEMTLLEWITQKDDFMECLFDICSKGIIQTDEREFHELQEEIEAKLSLTENETMKEIKGLGDRLCGLEDLMREARQYVTEQGKLADSFQKQNAKFHQCKDTSILPQFCSSQEPQLKVLLKNHHRLSDITSRCIRAKDELSSNLYHRLKWIVFVEGNLSELDNKLVFHFRNLLSLQRQLDILQQVHTASFTYLSSVVEVVRRRKISQAFLMWASDVACNLLTIYNDEISRRKDFQTQLEGHFLSSLFPGMEDFPPNFATQAPSLFDSSLPKLTEEDVDRLKRELPEMAHALRIPDTSPVTNYFMLKDTKDDLDKCEAKSVEDKLSEVVAEVGLASTLDQNILKAIEGEPQQTTSHGLPHLKDLDKGCESETDTEEFEKVGQSPFDLHFDKSISTPRPGTQDAATLTEENLQISRTEHENLKTALVKVAQLGSQVYTQWRTELGETKNLLLTEKGVMEETCSNLKASINKMLLENENKARETIQRITVDHELEISDFRKLAQSKNEEVKSLRDENVGLTIELNKVTKENLELKKRMDLAKEQYVTSVEEMRRTADELGSEKDRGMKDTIERLKSEHKSELENIRARFKLMTMERSPSENSLEKIERGDYPSITNHESFLLQMTENFKLEKDAAVKDAIEKEAQKWQSVLEDRIKQIEVDFAQEKCLLIQDVQNRIQQDQDKQISQLREQLNNIQLENIKHKDTIHQLTENKEDSNIDALRRIEELEVENADLKFALEKKEASGMAASVGVFEVGAATSDAATSPVKMKKSVDAISSRPGKLNVDSSKPGDLVLVVWDTAHQNYIILQESNFLHFLNTDCLESLGLKVVEGQPNKLHCYAEVEKKEYCHARKAVNRFKVPQGTKFFRVKVKPYAQTTKFREMSPPPPSSALASSHMSQSQTSTYQTSDVASSSCSQMTSHSLPSSPLKTSWNKSESQEATIPEERGEDICEEKSEGEVEKGTELTENFNVDNQSSIDR